MQADKTAITRLLKTARGQLDGILKMVDDDKYCVDISHQILACQAVLKKVNREILRSHMESCVRTAFTTGSPDEADKKIDELVDLISKY